MKPFSYRVAGIARPVEILYDPWGIPHIFAETEPDVFFGQGFAAARDRLRQIDLARRRALGRLAAVLGPSLVPYDQAARLFTVDSHGFNVVLWPEASVAVIDTSCSEVLTAGRAI